jgi:hypothetical protein
MTIATEKLAATIIANNTTDKKQVHRGRFLNINFAVQIDDKAYLIKVQKGRVESVIPLEKASEKPVFTFAAAAKDWEVFSQPYPPPGYQDVMAMVECGHAKLYGDVFPVLVNLFFVKGVVNGIRALKAA